MNRITSPEQQAIAAQIRLWCSLKNDRVQELRIQAKRTIVIRL